MEKYDYDEESSDDDLIPSSTISSRRDSSGSQTSYKSLLTQNLSASLFKSRQDSRRRTLRRRLPSRISRYLGFTLIFILIIFILSLIRASAISSRNVEEGKFRNTLSSPSKAGGLFPFSPDITAAYEVSQYPLEIYLNIPYPIPKKIYFYIQIFRYPFRNFLTA